MNLIYTTGWTRENLRSPEQYQNWINGLQDGDRVVMQLFRPASDSILDMPIERWEFELAKVWGNKLISTGDSHPFERETGVRTYWGGGEWGNVFPGRIVPTHSDLRLKELGDRVYGHQPVYEPLWNCSDRLVFLLEPGKDRSKEMNLLLKQFPRHYKLDCNEGVLIHCFHQGDRDEWHQWWSQQAFKCVKFLYSQYCKY